MSTKAVNSDLQKYLAIGGVLGLAYLAINHLTTAKSSSKTIPVETVRSILKQVKYQVYASCIPYSEGVQKKLKAYPKKDVEIYLRTELTKAYETKEELILAKYVVSKDEFTLALSAYQKDKQIKKDTEEIFKVLEETVRGEIDLSVPEPASQVNKGKELVRVYHAMCVDIGVAVWQKLMECIRNNPAFNAKDDTHFRKAMRQLRIYEFKAKYLAERGYKPEWGCPNFTFLKLLENSKKNDLEIKTECFYIEKGYEQIVTKISASPESYNKTSINRIMDDTIQKLKNPQVQAPNPVANQPIRQAVQAQPQPQPVQRSAVLPVQPQKPVFSAPPAVEEDQFDMEKLMMEELLNRSQEIPKEEAERKVEVPVVVEVKAEHVVEIKPEPVIEAQPEPVVEVRHEPEPEPVMEVKEGVPQGPSVVEVERVIVEPVVANEEPVGEQVHILVVEQNPVPLQASVADEPVIPPRAEEEAIAQNLLNEVNNEVEPVIAQQEQLIPHIQAPVDIPEEPVAEAPVQAEPQIQEPVIQEPEVVEQVPSVQVAAQQLLHVEQEQEAVQAASEVIEN